MKKGKDILGMPVYTAGFQQNIGFVSALLFDSQRNVWLVIETHEGKRMAVLSKKIDIDNRGIIVNDFAGCYDAKELKKIPTIFYQIPNNKPLFLMLHEGKEIGKISDILLDIKRGRVEAVEISYSLMDDIVKGRDVLILSGEETLNKDGMRIPEWEYNNIQRGGKGLKKLLGITRNDEA